MKKISLVLVACLLMIPLAACSSTTKEVEVPEEVAEFFINRKGEENNQILVDALVTNPEQTSAGPFPSVIEKYVAFGNEFIMVIDSDYGFDENYSISFCKGDYTDDPKEATDKHMPNSMGRSDVNQKEKENAREILLLYREKCWCKIKPLNKKKKFQEGRKVWD